MKQCAFCGVFFIPTRGSYHRHATHGILRGNPEVDPITSGTCWRCSTHARLLSEEIVPLDQGDMYGGFGQ